MGALSRDRRHTQQRTWRLHQGHLSSNSLSCPGLKLLTLIALAAQQRSQSEKRNRTNQRPTSQEKGLVRWLWIIRCVSPVPVVGRARHSGKVPAVETAQAGLPPGDGALSRPHSLEQPGLCSHLVWKAHAGLGIPGVGVWALGAVMWPSRGSGGCLVGRGTCMSGSSRAPARASPDFSLGWKPGSGHCHARVHRQAPASWVSPHGAGRLGALCLSLFRGALCSPWLKYSRRLGWFSLCGSVLRQETSLLETPGEKDRFIHVACASVESQEVRRTQSCSVCVLCPGLGVRGLVRRDTSVLISD